jgi:hypothetical protein
MPIIYELRVQGHLDVRWMPWFDGLAMVHLANGETQLMGPLADQAALHGVLERIRDLNLTLVAVERRAPGASG